MVFRVIFQRIIYRYVLNEKTIDRLAESYPIRMAARLVSRLVIRGQQSIEDNMKRIDKQEVIDSVKGMTTNRLSRFSQRFVQEFKEGMNNAKEELRRRQR